MQLLNFFSEFYIFNCLLITISNGKPMAEKVASPDFSEKLLRVEQPMNKYIQAYLDGLLMLGYEKEELPDSNEGEGMPLQVRCSLYLLDIHKIDGEIMKYRAQFYFRQSWNDSRQGYLENFIGPQHGIGSFILNDTEDIWTPDLFFSQEKECQVQSFIEPYTFIRISSGGEVHYSLRLSVTFSCPMNFVKYPHDNQKCIFTIESYGLTKHQLQLIWDDNQSYQALEASNEIDLLYFQLKSLKDGAKQESEKHGEYTHLQVELTFMRKLGFFVTKLYIPFTFLVAISWVTHFIPVKMAVPRLSVLLVIMHLMVNIAFTINQYVPPTSYPKGNDVWTAFCEALVLCSFMEYIFIYIIYRNKEKIFRQSDIEAHVVMDSDERNEEIAKPETANAALHMMSIRLQANAHSVTSKIDRAVQVLFPILFFF